MCGVMMWLANGPRCLSCVKLLQGAGANSTKPLAATLDQPPPSANAHPGVWSLVVRDMMARDRVGRERYGVPLQPHNGRDALVDLYQELLDAVVYLRQHFLERDGS